MTLNLYKASAGSGKTFALASNYIQLILKNPSSYRSILAITFTNMATFEMKSRILNELYKLAKNKHSAMLPHLLRALPEFSKSHLQKRAQIALQYILYDYSRFEISTIDSFFQKIIRSFAREIGIKSGYNIELDYTLYLKTAIDELIKNAENDRDLSDWLVAFTESNIEEGKTWKLNEQITNFAQQLFQEKYQKAARSNQHILNDKKLLNKIYQQFAKRVHSFESYMTAKASMALKLLDSHHLKTSDFKYGRGSFANYFNKILAGDFEPGARTRNAVNNIEHWSSPSKTSDQLSDQINAVYPEVNNLLIQLLAYYDQHKTDYLTAKFAAKNFYTLGILSDLSNSLDALKREQDVVFISDVNLFLNQIIDANDTPFIYEKTGTRYTNFLLDEFQDTSSFQWQNIRPLLLNSLDSNHDNLVVGDVKQSIYRWRNSNWQLLGTEIYKQLNPTLIKEFKLDVNYRSFLNIVSFNSDYFNFGAQKIAEILPAPPGIDILKMYAETRQNIAEQNKKRSGFVKIRFFKDSKDESWVNLMHEQLLNQLDMLMTNGFKPGDICLLVRKKSEGIELARLLTQNTSYPVISDEALLLKNSNAVNLLLNTLKYLNNQEDEIARHAMIYEYLRLAGEQNPYDFLPDQSETLLPGELTKLFQNYGNLSLVALTEKIIGIYDLNKYVNEHAYILSFLDLVFEFSQKNSVSLQLFLDWWEENADKKALSAPKSGDAIKIMTIHKSKGLDFEVVILPYFNWEFDPAKQEIIWVNNPDRETSELALLPVFYSGKLADTHFNPDYLSERYSRFIDNLNLAYVANTRARQGLIIYAPDSKEKGIKRANDLLWDYLKNMDDQFLASKTYICGKIKAETKESESTDIQAYKLRSIASNTTLPQISIKHSNIDIFDQDKQTHINYGKFIHLVLSKIKYRSDVQPALNNLLSEGYILNKEYHDLEQKILKIIDHPEVKNWFTKDWTIKTEQALLNNRNELHIPDRILIKGSKAVIIDYKSGKKDKKHQQQLLQYKADLEQLAYEVSSYLLYLDPIEVIEVK